MILDLWWKSSICSREKPLITLLFSVVMTESRPKLEHCCSLSQILFLLQLLVAVLSWVGYLSPKSLTDSAKISSGIFNLCSLLRLFSEIIKPPETVICFSFLILPKYPKALCTCNSCKLLRLKLHSVIKLSAY